MSRIKPLSPPRLTARTKCNKTKGNRLAKPILSGSSSLAEPGRSTPFRLFFYLRQLATCILRHNRSANISDRRFRPPKNRDAIHQRRKQVFGQKAGCCLSLRNQQRCELSSSNLETQYVWHTSYTNFSPRARRETRCRGSAPARSGADLRRIGAAQQPNRSCPDRQWCEAGAIASAFICTNRPPQLPAFLES